MIERAVCAKCLIYTTTSSMRLVRLGKSRRLICKTCAEKKSEPWFRRKDKASEAGIQRDAGVADERQEVRSDAEHDGERTTDDK